MKRKYILFLLVMFIGFVNSIYPMQQSDNVVTVAREVLSLDKGWRFHQGDIPFPVIKVMLPLMRMPKLGVRVGQRLLIMMIRHGAF